MPFYQATIPQLPDGLTLAGQTAVVTGATDGIGLELSHQLLRRGLDHLIIGARNLQKGGTTRLDLLGDPEVVRTNPRARVTVLSLDLSVTESAATFAGQVLNVTDRLDFVVLSAGINAAHWATSPEGNEMCFQVNVISNFVLQLILLPLLQSTSKTHYTAGGTEQPPTITWVGSMGQAFHAPLPGPLESPQASVLEHYRSLDKYSGFHRYPDTKLFVSMLSFQLASRLAADEGTVIVNNVCPGTVKTGADNNLPWYLRIPMNLNRLLRGRYVADGARAVFWAARGDLHKDQPNGFYVADNKPQEPAPLVSTPEGKALAKKLWSELFAVGQQLDKRVGNGLRDRD